MRERSIAKGPEWVRLAKRGVLLGIWALGLTVSNSVNLRSPVDQAPLCRAWPQWGDHPCFRRSTRSP